MNCGRRQDPLLSGIAMVAFLVTLAQPASAQTQTRRLAWDEDPTAIVTGFAVSVDGVRTDYGLTPRQADGSCGCSITLPFTSGNHVIVVSAYNFFGEAFSNAMTVAPIAAPGGPYVGQTG